MNYLPFTYREVVLQGHFYGMYKKIPQQFAVTPLKFQVPCYGRYICKPPTQIECGLSQPKPNRRKKWLHTLSPGWDSCALCVPAIHPHHLMATKLPLYSAAKDCDATTVKLENSLVVHDRNF